MERNKVKEISGFNEYNIVQDWNKLQGFSNQTDDHLYIRRNINNRHVTIENSAYEPIAIALGVGYVSRLSTDLIPKPQFILKDGESRSLAVNQHSGPIQMIYMFNVKGQMVGNPYPLRSDAQSFVLRQGINGWYVQAFKKSGCRGK